ncbi:hypothetical protein GCM10022419_116700 [Nonomuraea rosea]|uniref:BetI-type transcriptional repressor C-terminal domain-containing protein n=1 Tax=Nonomuraea rosea TaxID=638574 RepID=A0ABP6ZK25_9ACTN
MALRTLLQQGVALNEESTAESTVWLGFLASAVGDEELTALHHTNSHAWRRRVTRLDSAASPGWPDHHTTTVALALVALVEGTAALASSDPAGYPPATQEAMLDTALIALGLTSSSGQRE